MRAAAFSPRARRPVPPRKSATRLPLRIDSAAPLTDLDEQLGSAGGSIASAWRSAGSHWQSDGMINVAICPGARPAAAIACAVVSASDDAVRTLRIQPETGVASET